MLKWLRNVSISKKLYFTVGTMATLILIELIILQFAIRTLSSVRAYVGAEGLWSKAQKDAVYNLQKYSRSHNEADYNAFLRYMAVPLGDRKARTELEKKDFDKEVAKQGLLAGRVHPDDVDGAIKLFRRFRNIYYIDKAVNIWANGDTLIAQTLVIGESLHKEMLAASPERINAILAQLGPVNEKLTKLEDDFSYTLGEGSRWLTNLILKLLFGIVLTVEISGLTITILVSRGIARGLKEIINSSEKISQGDFNSRAKVYSEDEIGILANSFNEMTGKLEQNITDLKKTQDELKDSKDIAERSLAIKENFLTNMSHEIRTPMNAVIGFTDLLDNTGLNEQQKQYVQAIKISGRNLMTIINDILDYSRLESGRIVIEEIPFSVKETFTSLNVLIQQKAQEKGLALKFDTSNNIPETLVGDPTRLMQILLNLTDNAIKFTQSGAISITAHLQKHAEGFATIEFRVQDTGEGIAPDKLSMIFERFTQARAETSRRYGGTGLGLSIVKNLVELQEGKISVQSEMNKGSAFIFDITYGLPKGTVNAPATEAKSETPIVKLNRTLRILLAEDNKMNQMLATIVLKKFDFETDIAENGKIAVDMMQEKQYDIILMDMQMPEMDGYEATRIIREELKNNIPIIALTAHAMSDEKEKCLALGMNDYISKPFDAQDLYKRITSFFI